MASFCSVDLALLEGDGLRAGLGHPPDAWQAARLFTPCARACACCRRTRPAGPSSPCWQPHLESPLAKSHESLKRPCCLAWPGLASAPGRPRPFPEASACRRAACRVPGDGESRSWCHLRQPRTEASPASGAHVGQAGRIDGLLSGMSGEQGRSRRSLAKEAPRPRPPRGQPGTASPPAALAPFPGRAAFCGL